MVASFLFRQTQRSCLARSIFLERKAAKIRREARVNVVTTLHKIHPDKLFRSVMGCCVYVCFPLGFAPSTLSLAEIPPVLSLYKYRYKFGETHTSRILWIACTMTIRSHFCFGGEGGGGGGRGGVRRLLNF
jgi:hypothetical protein